MGKAWGDAQKKGGLSEENNRILCENLVQGAGKEKKGSVQRLRNEKVPGKGKNQEGGRT